MPTVTVKGMSCGHCQKAVEEAISQFPGVSEVHVDLPSGKASWINAPSGSPETEQVTKAIQNIGFEAL